MGSNPTPGTLVEAGEPEPLGRYVFADRLERRRWRFLIGSGMVFVLVVGSLAFVPQPPRPSTTLVVHQAAVQSRSPQAPAFVRVDRDSELGGGEEIRTDPSGSARIEYFDGSTTDLGGDTVYKVLELSKTPERSTVAGRLVSGRVWNSVRTTGPARFEVRIEHAWVLGSAGVHLIDCSRAPECAVVGLRGTTRVDVDGGPSLDLDAGRCVTIDDARRVSGCEHRFEELCQNPFTRRHIASDCRVEETPAPTTRPTPLPTPAPDRPPVSDRPPDPQPSAPATSTANEDPPPAEEPPQEAEAPEPTPDADNS